MLLLFYFFLARKEKTDGGRLIEMKKHGAKVLCIVCCRLAWAAWMLTASEFQLSPLLAHQLCYHLVFFDFNIFPPLPEVEPKRCHLRASDRSEVK